MKKISILCAFLVLITFSAQSQFNLGVKVGANVSKLSMHSENLTNFTAGPMIEVIVPLLGIGVDVSAMYSAKGFQSIARNAVSDPTGLSKNLKTTLHYIDVPVNFKWKFGIPGFKIFLAAGPNFGFMLNQNDYKKFDFGLNAAGGVELFKKVQLAIGYQFGLTDVVKPSDYPSEIRDLMPSGKNRTITATLTYIIF